MGMAWMSHFAQVLRTVPDASRENKRGGLERVLPGRAKIPSVAKVTFERQSHTARFEVASLQGEGFSAVFFGADGCGEGGGERLPGGRGSDEAVEEGAGDGVGGEGALGVPLDSAALRMTASGVGSTASMTASWGERAVTRRPSPGMAMA